MKTVQQKVMDYVEECVDEVNRRACAPREVTVSKDWENTGRLYLFKGDDTYEVKFNFQVDSCSLRFAEGERHYHYAEDMPLLKLHLKSFVKFGDHRVLRN